jgi:hypothetical protein
MPHTSAPRPVRGSSVRRDRHERSDPDTAPEAPVVAVQRIGGPDRRALGLAWLAVAAIVLAVAKPWGGVPPAGSRTAAAVAPRPQVSTPTATPPRPGVTTGRAGQEIPCWSSEDWRAVTVERRERQTVISWMAVEPVSALGPDDARIPLLRIVADHVTALGFCEPLATDVPVESLSGAISMWRRVSDGTAERVEPLRAAAPLAADAAAVFRPGRGEWRPGRYAVQVLATAARARDGRPLRGRWFGFEIVPLPHDATPSPPQTATPPPAPGSKRVSCALDGGWSLVTLELDGDVELQTAYPTQAVAGPADPEDSRLVVQPLAGTPAAIGFCPPGVDVDGRPLDVTGARFWRRNPTGTALRLNAGDRLGSASGERDPWLYGPPSIVGGLGSVPWPPGTYVVAVDAVDTRSYWLALTLGPGD